MAHEPFYFSESAGWEILAEGQAVRRVPRGPRRYFQDETDSRFYYLKKGRVRIFLNSDDGAERTLVLRESGSIFGEAAFFDGQPRMSSARTVTDCEIVAVGRAELMAVFRREPGIAMQMLQFLAKTVRMLSAQVDTMTFFPADRRLAGVLVSLCGRDDAVHASQEELGSLTGVTRVTVSRVLQMFVKRGWVRLGYRTVQVLEKKALEDFAK